MNDRRPRELDVPLRFLGSGRYRAEIFADDPQEKYVQRLARRTEEIGPQDTLKIRLASAGGYLARLIPMFTGK